MSQLRTRCPGFVCSTSKPKLHYDVIEGECFCAAADTCTQPSRAISSAVLPKGPGLLGGSMSRTVQRVEKSILNMVNALDIWNYLGPDEDDQSEVTEAVHAVLTEIHGLTNKIRSTNSEMRQQISTVMQYNLKLNDKRQEPAATFSTSLDPAAPTFIPPPKTDITPDLINQSLTSQPDNAGVVTGVIPVFRDGVLMFPVQFEGPIAPIIPINCSTSLPCGLIGNGPDPNIVIGPKYVQDGTQQTIVADCLVIAVNMYDPNIINYVIQNSQGETFSLVGGNKIQDIDKIDTSAPVALTLQSTLGSTKRSVDETKSYVIPKRYQVHKNNCRTECTRRGYFIAGLDDFCGCMDREDHISVSRRSGISAPDATEATMSAKACAAMTCINNGGKPAVFNPFSLTCWCVDQPLIEDNPSGWVGRMRARVVRALQKMV